MTVRPEELPGLQQAVLDDATLDALVTDLLTMAEVREVTLKHAARQHTELDQVPLSEAIRLLRSGGTRGVQIHYRHAGQLWTDTLLSTPNGVRLVRMQSPFA